MFTVKRSDKYLITKESTKKSKKEKRSTKKRKSKKGKHSTDSDDSDGKHFSMGLSGWPFGIPIRPPCIVLENSGQWPCNQSELVNR